MLIVVTQLRQCLEIDESKLIEQSVFRTPPNI